MIKKSAHKLIKLLSTFSLSFVVGCSEPTEVDLIIHNAKIYSVDEGMQTFDAMAINKGIIVELGAENQILNKYNYHNKIDAEKAFIFPGFIDAHSHLLGFGLSSMQLNLVGTTSYRHVLQEIKNYQANRNSDWIVGRGWDQNDWEVKEYPVKDSLDQMFPDTKIALKRVDGHAMLVSSSVLELANIDGSTKIDGGEIKLDQYGNPTGILIDEAMTLVEEILPKPDRATKIKALKLAQQICFEYGLTTVTDAGLEVEDVNLINSLQNQGDLAIRINAMYSANPLFLSNGFPKRIQTDLLTARSIKIYCDGALGSRGARLLSPYADDTTSIGLFITPPDSINKWAEACKTYGFQMAVHCIGTGGNRATLNEMGQMLKGTNDLRWRIEHAQVVHPEDRNLFGTHNILPSMQPTHATSDMYWAEARLGKSRIPWAYSLKSLLKQNGMIALGTDFPVESANPLMTFYAAITRKDKNGYPAEGFMIEEALTREEALRGMTIWPALSSFDDSTRGSLEPGKFADLVILNKDLLTCDNSEILEVEIQKTIINGKLVYEK